MVKLGVLPHGKVTSVADARLSHILYYGRCEQRGPERHNLGIADPFPL
jgi:hypothetical protein